MKQKQSRTEKMVLPRPKMQLTKTAVPAKLTTRSKPTASPTKKNPTVAGGADDGADDDVAVTTKTISKRRAARSKQRLPTKIWNLPNLPRQPRRNIQTSQLALFRMITRWKRYPSTRKYPRKVNVGLDAAASPSATNSRTIDRLKVKLAPS